MARAGTPLDAGDPMAELSMQTLSHGRLEIPTAFNGKWGVVLLYRGHWCSYCARQLATFEQGLPELEYAGIRVIAASTDDEEGARRLADIAGATFPVGYGLPMLATAEKVGGYYDEGRGVLQASGFVVQPSGRIAVATYSTGAIGRLMWEDVVRLVAFWDPDS